MRHRTDHLSFEIDGSTFLPCCQRALRFLFVSPGPKHLRESTTRSLCDLTRTVPILSIILLTVSIFVTYSPQARAQSGDSWTTTTPMSFARAVHTATLLNDGRVLVAGGISAQGYLASSEIYDPNPGTWSITGSMSIPRGFDAAVRLLNGRVLVAGGGSANPPNGFGFKTPTSEIYDPGTGLWSSTGSLNLNRTSFGMVLLDNGKALAIGGFGTLGRFLTTCELYDPASGTWSLTGSLHTGRADIDIGNAIAKLRDGRVLVEGGLDPNNLTNALSSAEIYDPSTGSWSLTGSMNVPRIEHGAALLQDGRVLVAGGVSPMGSGSSTSEIFDPTTGTWSMLSSMTGLKVANSATALQDGRVLDVGPFGTSTEIYDPTAGSWTVSAPRTISTREHTATLLLDGRVLVAGGGDNGIIYSQVDIFTPKAANRMGVTQFFTDLSLNPLPVDSQGNPIANVTISDGTVRYTDPHRILAWVNVSDTSGFPIESLKLNETLPTDWIVSPSHMLNGAIGAIHVFYANGTSLATETDITKSVNVTISNTNPERVGLAVPSFTSIVGHPLLSGQSILLSVRLGYGIVGTSQSAASYPRTYMCTVAVAAWTQEAYRGTQFAGHGSALFVADAKIVV